MFLVAERKVVLMCVHCSLCCRERVWINGIMVVCGAFLFFLLVTGCILKIGRDSLCNSVIQNVPNVTRLDTPTPPKQRLKSTGNETRSNQQRLCVPAAANRLRANRGPLL